MSGNRGFGFGTRWLLEEKFVYSKKITFTKRKFASLTCTARLVSSQNTCLCTVTLGMANTPLVTCHPVLFDVKTTYFYLILLSFIIFILFLYCFYLIFIILVFLSRFRRVPEGSKGFRVGSWGFRVSSGWFRQAPEGSGWVPRFTYTPVKSCV